MDHALRLAARGLGRCWPNPAVGCVIVSAEDRIVGRGVTADGGRPHAETQALEAAGSQARGATAYVTLEPCAHHGATPPCAEALIAAGVARVVVGIEDPDPRVAGRGLAMLRAAGIAVVSGVRAEAARRVLAGHLSRVEKGRPLLTLKLAASLDGKIATSSGDSRWITGPQARRAVHAMRLRHDAVMVGAGTARADDPMLTVRDLGADRQPVRVVVDGQGRVDPAGRLGQTAREVPVWVVTTPAMPEARAAAWEAAGARLIEVAATEEGHTAPQAALRALAEAGLTRVFCEGGGGLAAALLAAGLVDRLAVFHAGVAIGAGGVPALGAALAPPLLAQAPRLRLCGVRAVGGDVLSEWEAAP